MFRHELSPFLERVLSAISRLPDGISVDSRFEPDPRQLTALAAELRENADDVRQAILGLRAAHCLLETPLEIPGIEPMYRWEVHPQLVENDGRRSTPRPENASHS